MSMLPVQPGQPYGGMEPNIDPSMMQMGQVKRGGMFGGNAGNIMAAALAGFVSRRNPAPLQALLQMQMQKQETAQRQQDYQQRRQDQNADWQSHYDYELHNPKPPEQGEFERALIASGVQPGTPQWAEKMGTRVNNMLDPVVMTPYGPVPRSVVMGGGQQAPAKPLTDEDILRMQGGPTPQASGGFPRPY